MPGDTRASRVPVGALAAWLPMSQRRPAAVFEAKLLLLDTMIFCLPAKLFEDGKKISQLL